MIQNLLLIGSYFPEWGISANKCIINILSFTLKDIAKPAAKTIAFQQNSLDPPAKVVLDNRIALDYLLTEQRGGCTVVTLPAAPGLTLPRKLKLSCIRSHRQTTLLKWLIQQDLFFTYIILTGLGLGDHGSAVNFRDWNYPAYANHSNLLSGCVLSKALNASSQMLTTKWIISLWLERPKKEQRKWPTKIIVDLRSWLVKITEIQ